MTARPAAAGRTVLYTPTILALAVELADYPLADTLSLRSVASSRVCGSRVEIGLATAPDGTVAVAGARVTACAIGQAAAALFLRGVAGLDKPAIVAGFAETEAWLGDRGSPSAWPGLDLIAAARDYPARHAAILLPWRAALAALSNPAAAH